MTNAAAQPTYKGLRDSAAPPQEPTWLTLRVPVHLDGTITQDPFDLDDELDAATLAEEIRSQIAMATDAELISLVVQPKDSVIRIEWPGEPHPDGRLAKLVRINRGGKPVVRMYAYTVGAERVVEAPYVVAGEADVLLAEAIDRVCNEVGDDGPRGRDRRGLA